MISPLRVFARNALIAKNAIEKCLGRVRDQEFVSNHAKYPNSVALKAADKFYLLLVSSDAHSMARIEMTETTSEIRLMSDLIVDSRRCANQTAGTLISFFTDNPFQRRE
jgi:hypothetical protein